MLVTDASVSDVVCKSEHWISSGQRYTQQLAADESPGPISGNRLGGLQHNSMVVMVDDQDVTNQVGQISDTASCLTRGFQESTASGLGSLKRDPFETMLDRIGLGYLVLDEHKKVIRWNSLAKDALNIPGQPRDLINQISSAFKHLITDVPCQFSPGTLCWIVIPYLGGRPVVVHEKCDFAPSGQSVVFLLARDTKRKTNGLRLQKLFGLTGAETEVALSIACGHTLLEIAQSRNLSRTTVRSQLASLFAKTDTRRQSDLLALLTKMSVLP